MTTELFNDALTRLLYAFESQDKATFEAAVNAAKEAVKLTERDALTQQQMLKCLDCAIEEFPELRAFLHE